MRPHRPQKPPRPPMFQGEPSPALAKLNRMNMADLASYIEKLGLEQQRLAEKITNLRKAPNVDPGRIDSLDAQAVRVAALEQVAREMLEGKEQRRREYDSGERPRRGGGRRY